MSEKIIKPWGFEQWLEVNDKYVVKLLCMKQGERCSLQYHQVKHETVYVLEGSMKFTSGTTVDNLQETILNPGEYVVIPPNTIHRMEGVLDSLYLEASTPELEDVVRLQDNYGRQQL